MKDTWYYYGEKKVPKDVTVVVVENGVSSLPNCAFHNCNQMIFIDIPDSVIIIEDGAFSGCTSLRSIDLPLSINTITHGTFYKCTSLLSLQLLSVRLTRISEFAFESCTSLESIQFPLTLERIDEGAFYGCSSLTTLKLPPSLDWIGYNSFRDCKSLTSICLPSSCRYDTCVFEGCTSLKSIQFYSPNNKFTMGAFDILLNMIQLNPEFAQRPCTDSSLLPLHLFLIYGWGCKCDEISFIWKASPEALSILDPINNMFPFLLAACSPAPDDESDDDDDDDDDDEDEYQKKCYLDKRDLNLLECVYMLLREAPWVLMFAIKSAEQPEKESDNDRNIESFDQTDDGKNWISSKVIPRTKVSLKSI